MSKRKKQVRNTILFLLLNVVVIMVLILLEDKDGDLSSGKQAMAMFGQHWYFVLLGYIMFFVIVAGDTVVFYGLTKRMCDKKSLPLAIKVSILGRYYDRITPWAVGGEPFQMAYLYKNDISTAHSCAITMSRHIIRFFTVAIVVISILIFSRVTTNVWVMVTAIVSVLGGLVVPVFMLICAFKPKIGEKIVTGVLKFLTKIKIVKDYDKQLSKWQAQVNDFLVGIQYLSVNKNMIIVISLVSVVELFAVNSVPYFIMCGLGMAVDYWSIFVLCVFVTYASSLAPTPGGAGIAELSFYAIFASVIAENYIFWAVLMWRIAIFYLPIFIGFVTQTIESFLRLKQKI